MTNHDVKETLQFRKNNFNSVWDESNQESEQIGHSSGARSLVFHPNIYDRNATSTLRSPENRLAEAVSLSAALELDIVFAEVVTLNKIRPATFLGKGKLDEMSAIIKANDIELVVADCELSPGQQRNLERKLKVKVIDRTGLILEIFGERAQTKEGVLQVELAHLSYQKSRLVRSWTHLERQRGGFGFMGGPGESQIESDRRLIDERIGKIKKQLSTVIKTRELHRNSRRKVPFPIIALVGYTNAGKSTLFNYLTNAKVMAEDLLFATLDPTMRNVDLPNGQKVIFSDTVGFISDLPTHLVAAFRATLEEVTEADIILHVRDISHPDTEAQKQDVEEILKSLGVLDEESKSLYEVWNKVDLFEEEERSFIANMATRLDKVTLASAVSGEGCAGLLSFMEQELAKDKRQFELTFEHKDGADIALFYQYGEVLNRIDTEENSILTVWLDAAAIGQLTKMGKLNEGE
jgi:GTP-binding protein HflX